MLVVNWPNQQVELCTVIKFENVQPPLKKYKFPAKTQWTTALWQTPTKSYTGCLCCPNSENSQVLSSDAVQYFCGFSDSREFQYLQKQAINLHIERTIKFKESWLKIFSLNIYRVQCGLVGSWRVDVWNDGRKVSIWYHYWQSRHEHWRLPLPRYSLLSFPTNSLGGGTMEVISCSKTLRTVLFIFSLISWLPADLLYVKGPNIFSSSFQELILLNW